MKNGNNPETDQPDNYSSIDDFEASAPPPPPKRDSIIIFIDLQARFEP